MRQSKQTRAFLKKNRKKNPASPQDKELRTFLNLGGRVGARKDFFSFLKKAVKTEPS